MDAFGVIAWLNGDEQRIEAARERIATRCQGQVRADVHERIGDMTDHEARGYIRARASAVIRRAAEDELEADRRLAPHRVRIVAESSHRLVEMTLAELRGPNSRRILRRAA